MDLLAFVDSKSAPVAFKVEGIEDELHCKVLTLEEMNKVILTSEKGDTLAFSANFLAACIVTPDGRQIIPEVDRWRGISARGRDTFNALVKRAQQINGMVSEDEAADLGKPSAPAPESASSSTSASD